MSRWKKDDASKGAVYLREWSLTEKGQEYRKRSAERAREWRKANPEYKNLIQQRSYEKIRMECFTRYGGAVCRCCGEKEVMFLHLDHINGDGAARRKDWVKENGKIMGGTGYYYWLKKNNWPEDLKLQVLCANCNLGKRTKKYCPHELRRGIDMNGNIIPAADLPQPLPPVTRRLRGEAQREADELGVKVATLRMRRWTAKHPTPKKEKVETTHCKNGHAYADNNLYQWKGHKQCRQCKRDYKKRINKLTN